MGTILKIGAFLFGFLLLFKVVVHIYLDYSNGRKAFLGPNQFLPISYFLPYYSEVDKQYSGWKWMCNFFYKAAIFTLVVNILIALLKNL